MNDTCPSDDVSRLCERGMRPTIRALAMMTLTLHGVAAGSEATVGAWRISALSDRLVRVEPRGPRGFEDSQTFSIVGRSKFEGIALKQINGELPGRYAAHADAPSDYSICAPSRRHHLRHRQLRGEPAPVSCQDGLFRRIAERRGALRHDDRRARREAQPAPLAIAAHRAIVRSRRLPALLGATMGSGTHPAQCLGGSRSQGNARL